MTKISKSILFIFVLGAAQLFFHAGSAVAASGWSMFSLPCDMSMSDFKVRAGDQNIKVFEWTGSVYTTATAIKRGYGYIINKNPTPDTASFCAAANEILVKVNLQLGWNLLGNPFSRDFIFEFAENSGISGDITTFTYSNGIYAKMSPDTFVKNGGAFWFYTDKLNSITLVPRPLCADGSLSENGACPDVWLYIQPIQCGLNPWEDSFNQPYSSPYIESDRIKSFYKIEHNINILDVRSCRFYKTIFDSCTYSRGDLLSLLMNSDDAIRFKNNDLTFSIGWLGSMRFEPIIISAAKNPPMCYSVCNGDVDCKNNEAGEKGYCLYPGTSEAKCGYGYSVDAGKCCTNSGCDDSDSGTQDACVHPADSPSYCEHTKCAIACSSDDDCNDGNASTVDRCQWPSSCGSVCTHGAPVQNSSLIRLKYAEFDPLVSEPYIPPDLSATQTSDTDKKLYIVQFNDKIGQTDQAIAGEISSFEYIPDNAYLMMLNNSDIETLKSRLSIRAFVEYKPAYKLNTNSLDALLNKQCEIDVLAVMVFKGADSEMTALVGKLGGKSEFMGDRFYRVFIPNCKLIELLRSSSIIYLGPPDS